MSARLVVEALVVLLGPQSSAPGGGAGCFWRIAPVLCSGRSPANWRSGLEKGSGPRLERREEVDQVELLANDIAPMLAVVASSRKKDNLISYGELVRLLKALKPDEYEDLEPRSDVFHSALEIVSDRSLEAHGFALSSVVVNARTGIPGSGFFEAAISRWQLPNAQKVPSRREGIDPESPGYRMWTEQASRAIEHYSR
jgi:hypothetical protein